MTPSERAAWEKIQRRAATMQPELAAAIFRAYAILRASLTVAALERYVEERDPDALVRELLTLDLLERSLLPFRERVRQQLARQVKYFAVDLPRGGRIDGQLAIAFDYLNPRVIDAVRELETKAITTLRDDVRETVRAFVENGLRDGQGTAKIAREIKATLGLAPNQETAVRNFERALRGENGNPLRYKLRDKRFDGTIRKGEPLTEAQIDTQVAAYRRKMEAFHANTVARTTALDATRLAQRLSWEDAIEKGIVDRDRLMKRRLVVQDGRQRDEHQALYLQVRRFDEPYDNGEVISGELSWNCRCVDQYFQAA